MKKILLFLLVVSLAGQVFSQTRSVPLVPESFSNIYSIPAVEDVDGLKFSSVGQRNGSAAVLKDGFNAIGQDIYIKWFIGDGPLWGNIRLEHTPVTLNQYPSFDSNLRNKWVFTRIRVNTDYSYSITSSSGNYDNQGGTILLTPVSGVVPEDKRVFLENTTVGFRIWDCTETSYIKIGEMIVPAHGDAQFYEISLFDFEDQLIPEWLDYQGNASIVAGGKDSGYAFHIVGNGTVNPQDSVSFVVGDADLVTFDLKINHNNTFRVYPYVDGQAGQSFSVYYAGSTTVSPEWCEMTLPVRDGSLVSIRFSDRSNQDLYIDNIRMYNLNTSPSNLTLNNNNLDENASVSTVVGNLLADDADSDPLTYSLTENDATDNDFFAISGLSLGTAAVFDYETVGQYQIEVAVSDGISDPVLETFTISINDVNEAPVIAAGQTLSVFEESPVSTVVGSVTATDEDSGDNAPVFSIQSGNEDGFFALDAATGELTLVQAGLNRYGYESFSLLVRATDQSDAQLYSEETVVVNVDEIPFSGGAGTEADPFLIKTPKDLDEIRNYLGSSHSDKYFELVNDIDLQEYLSEGNPGYNNGLFWKRLGYDEYFEGHLNGNSFSVLNLKINRPNDYINGLFGHVSSAEIINLNVSVDPLSEIVGLSSTAILAGSVSNGSIISNVHVSGKVNAQPGNVGGLAGAFANGSVISDCSATVEVVSTGSFVGGLIGVNNGTILRCHVEGDITGARFVGGIAGYSNEEGVVGGRGLIQQCSVGANSVVTATTGTCGGLVGQNAGDVTGCSSFATVNAPVNAGGLVGNNEEVEADMMMFFENYEGRINNSYASGVVTATDGTAGGLVGQNTGDIENCYALGAVNAPLNAGGLVGENLEIVEVNTEGGLMTGSITNCYSATLVNGSDATIGGFAGVNDGEIISSYWDINASGQEISAGGTGLNGIAMREAASFVDWDFTNVWGIDALEEYVSYPYLLDNEENPHPGAIGKVTVTSWPTASDIVYGQVVGESVLSGGAATHEGSSVSGTFYFMFVSDMNAVGIVEEEVAFFPTNAESFLPVIDGSTSLNVLPKPVSVVNAVAQNKIYDGTTVAVVSDAVLEDNAVEGNDDVVLSNHTSGTFAQAGAGDGITVTTNMTLTGPGATNYALEQPDLTASISKASLTVAADDQTRLYGEANPELTFGYSGFVNGEDASALTTLPTVSTLADAGSNVGDYAITVGDGSDENYDFSYVDGVLSVNPAPLSVKAKDATRIVGAPNPEFELEYTGFVNGEDQSVIDFLPGASCEADEFSEPGDYPIIVSPGDDGNYYFIVDNSGVLTVTTATSILQEFNGETNVYPVPADTYLFVSGIHIVSVSDVEVVDMSGRTIKTPYSETDTGSLRVDVSSLKSGIYFLKIKMNERMILEKIVVL